MDLSELLIDIRAKSGDHVAENYSNGKKCEELFLQVESLSMSLQMEFNRVQGTNLHKLKTQDVGNQIRDITEDGINKILDLVFSNEKLYIPYLEFAMEEIQRFFSESAANIFVQIKDLHLTYHFQQIVWQIKSFDYQTIIRMLECLIIAYIFRRYNRRKSMPEGCYSCYN